MIGRASDPAGCVAASRPRGSACGVRELSAQASSVEVMRILHTSDWHLGRSFHGASLLEAQAGFVDHLLEVVEAEQVDIVLLAGDVYDRALPPVDAVQLADEAFARLADSRAGAVVTSGNHDSHVRLGFNARLADAAGVHFRTRWQQVGTPVVREDADGPVAFYGLPYLEPDAVRAAWELPARTHEAALSEAMVRVRADLASRPRTRSVVMAHAFVAGSEEAAGPMASDSERDIAVGGLQVVPTRVFADVDYVALGHLHGRHTLTDRVRYSGSPLAYSFSERHHRKGSWLVDLDRAGATSAEFVAAPVPRRLSVLRGRLDDLLTEPAHAPDEQAWVQATLTDPRRPDHAMERLRRRFPPHRLPRLRARGSPCLTRTDRAAGGGAQRRRHRAGVRGRGARPRGHHRGGAAAAAGLRLLPDQRRPRGRRAPRPGRAGLMRLHRLEVTAFGPFAETNVLDMGALNEAGLFLLSGPTGAGKTSLLDAVCFALYGTVPGSRGVRTLKSQHADPQTAPEVVLDFGVGSRRFVVRRRPAWERPKRRGGGTGQGTVVEPARASLLETTDAEHLLSSRAQEVGHLVTDLMGMSSEQFKQVVLLPQGEFHKFLHADSSERHDVLQQLFHTRRFTEIEDWVAGHSRRLSAQAVQQEHAVRRLLDAIADRVEDPPAWLAADALGEAADLALPWVDAVLDSCRTRLSEGETARALAVQQLARLRADHATATRTAEAHRRRAEAQAVLDALRTDEDHAETSRRRLDEARRAERCAPLMKLLDQATLERDRAVAAHQASLAPLGGLGRSGADDPAPHHRADDKWRDLEAALRLRGAQVEALLPRERQRDNLVAQLAEHESELAGLLRDRADLAARAEVLPPALERLRSRRVQLHEVAGRREACASATSAAVARLTGATTAHRFTERVEQLREAHRDARDRAADAREQVQELMARRLAGMAAELAGALRDGLACRVCGSTDHPEPAAGAADDAVTEPQQQRAAAVHEELAAALEVAVERLGSGELELELARQASGGLDEPAARDALREAEGDQRRAEAAAHDLEVVDNQLADLEQQQVDLGRELAAYDVRTAGLGSTLVGLRARAAALSRELGGALADRTVIEAQTDMGMDIGTQVVTGPRSLREELDLVRATLETVLGLRRTATELVAADRALDDVAGEVAEVATACGFPDPTTARAALLDVESCERLETALASRDLRDAQARAALADPAVAATVREPPPDLPSLSAQVDNAEQAATEAAATSTVCRQQLTALQQQRARLEVALRTWTPAREESTSAESMARLVRGTGHDNQLQLRLSSYVLATRLDQVVAAANERLGHMRDHRYLLQRTARAARRGSQAGLGLEVLDQWTGEVRSPGTLSGGETFVASLCLALGLADVVTHEAGGTSIETLFVDEGFGTLDADTLDDVMDRLDGLRAGGRTVGVVSHVSELRNRIPTQVRVVKGRAGSQVTTRTSAP